LQHHENLQHADKPKGSERTEFLMNVITTLKKQAFIFFEVLVQPVAARNF